MSSTDLSALTILVTSDNRNMRGLVRGMLRAFGMTNVIEAVAGDHALGLLYGSEVDVLILDQLGPPEHCLDFVRRLRSELDSPAPIVPLIMMTGHATREMVTAARDAGVTEFLAKPVAPKALALRLWSIVARPRPFVRTGSYFGPCRRRHGGVGGWLGGERRQEVS